MHVLEHLDACRITAVRNEDESRSSAGWRGGAESESRGDVPLVEVESVASERLCEMRGRATCIAMVAVLAARQEDRHLVVAVAVAAAEYVAGERGTAAELASRRTRGGEESAPTTPLHSQHTNNNNALDGCYEQPLLRQRH